MTEKITGIPVKAGEAYQRFANGQGWLSRNDCEEPAVVELGPGQAVFIYTDDRSRCLNHQQMGVGLRMIRHTKAVGREAGDATGWLIWWGDVHDCGYPWEDQSGLAVYRVYEDPRG